jgi:outer membrane phospholipase A
MHIFRSLLLASLLAFTTKAHGVIFSLVSPSEPVANGAEVRLDLLVLNPGAEALSLQLPGIIKGSLCDETRCWPVELKAAAMSGQVQVAPGGFSVREYRVTLPRQATGMLVLDITEPVTAKVAIEARTGLKSGTPVGAPLSNFVPPKTVEAAIHRTFAGRFSAHEPIYFIYGEGPQAAKFQFSFKYRLLGTGGELSQKIPALRRLFIGYTQRSVWNIDDNSSPFYDTSYMPELLFESQAVLEEKGGGGMHWLGYQVGLKHESNGSPAFNSRSMNTVYFRPGVAFGDLDGWNVILAPRFHAYVGDLVDNPDLKDYRGNVEFMAAVGRNDYFAVSLIGRLGRSGHKGSIEADLTIPVKAEFLLDFATYILIQYWNGYGESLLDYNVRSSSIRAGFSLVR